MNTDFIVSVVSVTFAALSPIILTLMNHKHEAKMKSVESKFIIAQSVEVELYKSKVEAFKNLFKSAGDYLISIDTRQEYLYYGKIVSAVGESAMHCSESSMKLLEEFNQCAEDLYTVKSIENYDRFNKSINSLHAALRSELCADKQI